MCLTALVLFGEDDWDCVLIVTGRDLYSRPASEIIQTEIIPTEKSRAQ